MTVRLWPRRPRLWAWIACRVLGTCDMGWNGPGSWSLTCSVCGRRWSM